ncbi:MAG: hypothetical protein LQ344_001936 [Seirophora lacunosa]|nr:MAG: hypothetical protein LQ344_001936 [Seirophora lacunosa]
MDNANTTGTFKSPIFEIWVGPPEKAERFYAHAHILSKSEVLKAEVEGPWKEEKERKIEWPHWTVGAAEKFLDWLYAGDYVCPYPVQRTQDSDGQKDPAPEENSTHERSPIEVAEPFVDNTVTDDQVVPDPQTSTWDVTPPPRKKKGKKSARAPDKIPSPPLKVLQGLSWDGCRQPGKLTQAEEFDSWTGHQLWSPSELDYEATLMTHAELYVMADQYMLIELKSMAWQRLRSVLVSIGKPSPEWPLMENLTNLIHYTYEQTSSSTEGGGEEPLRMLVSTFVALNFANLGGLELVVTGEAAHREFVVDLLAKVKQQMSSLQSQVAAAQNSPPPPADDVPGWRWG